MTTDVEPTRFRVRLKGWVLLNGGLVLLLVLPVSVVVVTGLLHSTKTSHGTRATATSRNGAGGALWGLPSSGTRPSAQEVAQELRNLALAAESTTPAGVPPSAVSAAVSPVLALPSTAPTGGPTQAPSEPVTTAVPTTVPEGHRPPPPPPTTAPPPPPTTVPSVPTTTTPTTAPTTVPMTASAWNALYGSMLGRLSAEVTNAAYYSGAGSDFSQFVANVTSAEHFPSIPATGSFAFFANSTWQQALAKLSTLVSDGELCLKGTTRQCHEKRLSSSASAYLGYARADLQRAVTLGE